MTTLETTLLPMPGNRYPIPIDLHRCLFGEARWGTWLLDIQPRMMHLAMFHLRCPVRIDYAYVTGRI